MKLSIELVPKTSFFTNVRSIVSKNEWNKIRIKTLEDANYVCEICGGRSSDRYLDCHEVWIYDDINHIQKLEKFMALCTYCHEVKHIGLAEKRGYLERATRRFMKINNIDEKTANNLIVEAFNTWEQRSRYIWQLDITILENFGQEEKI
jgi:hypothetical protein